jgi:hypothetical protein
MTDKCHGLPITIKRDLVALGIEGVRRHCLLMLMDTGLLDLAGVRVTFITTIAIMFQAQRIHPASNNVK